jgi:type II secretion system protein I
VDSTRTDERGFTLLELLVCMAIVAVTTAATLGAFAALARNATPGTVRDLALMTAENALARARAAVAYASSSTQDGPALLGDRSWALTPGETRYVAGAQLRPGSCGNSAPAMLQLPVVATYDPPNERFTVTVTYPRDPCRVASDGTIPAGDAASAQLAETLPPSVYPPGQTVHRDISTPARM